MKWIALSLAGATALAGALAAQTPTTQTADEAGITIYRGKLPDGYRDWRLISVAREEGKIDDIRAILGNDLAIKAYREGAPPFPQGTIIARLAWAFSSSDENNRAFGKSQSFVAGHPKNGIQFMVKDSAKYAATGGWGYFQFDNGQPLSDPVVLQNCFACHQAVKARDFVFTHYAP
jgi:hypothetical protein